MNTPDIPIVALLRLLHDEVAAGRLDRGLRDRIAALVERIDADADARASEAAAQADQALALARQFLDLTKLAQDHATDWAARLEAVACPSAALARGNPSIN